ncbi:MAG: protoporphyrinogen/coproporphyrinogen oxidase [Solirubrobacteraceae bacterium]
MKAGERPTAAVVGGGLSGLVAAYRLSRAGWAVTVFEREPQIGGRVETIEQDGYVIDTAATAVGGSYHAYVELVAELGLRIIPAPPYTGIARDGQLHLIRMDQMVRSGLRTRLLSPTAKVRAIRLGFDAIRAKRKGWLDYSDMRKAAPLDTESTRDYARRALGAELDSYLCEPITRAMMMADTDKVSKVELLSGIANVFIGRWGSLQGGSAQLPRTLAKSAEIRTECPVERVFDHGAHVEVVHRGASGVPEAERFDACVVAAPLHAAAGMCPQFAELFGPLTGSLEYTQAISVAVGTTVRPDCPALLMQLPSREDRNVALLFLDHNKGPERTPAGHGLFTADWEMAASAEAMHEPDEVLVERTLSTIYRLFPEVRDTVDFTHVRRWPLALMHTKIGAFRRIGEFNAALDPRSRIQFAADYMSEAGQNTAVTFGSRAAANLIAARTGTS